MQYGFVINQDTCIGCHACTVACKSENDVPVGSFRTNVKYVETGKFPQVKRSFLVQRCNQCTNAPCVTICPVNALTKRADGIVDVDRDACIGCRACMQACPYDALYLNEDLGAVEKCHFCAHRVEKGLQPACVTVCPVGAIIPGDFHDPTSEVSLIKRAQTLSARRPEQKTGPNVFYIGANEVALNPGSAERPRQYLWSDRRDTKPEDWPTETVPNAMEVLNADHEIEWGWPVSLYLVTKGVAAGAAMIAPFFALLGPGVPWWLPETIALVFTLVTVFLLVEDLKKPMHFYKLFTRPNWDSWLVKGGIVLTAFGALTSAILISGLLGVDGAVGPLRWANGGVAVLVAGYTAFLFAQCKGRDLWEGRGLFMRLVAQSVTAGAAFLLIVDGARFVTLWSLLIGAFSVLLTNFVPPRERERTENFKQAVAFMHDADNPATFVARQTFWLAPFCAVLAYLIAAQQPVGERAILVLLGAIVLFALFEHEHSFVRAGQLPPLS